MFREYFQKVHLSGINEFDEYYHFLFSRKLIGIQNDQSIFLEKEVRETLSKIVDYAKQSIADIDRGDAIKYINAHYQRILGSNESDFDLCYETSILIIENLSGIKKAVLEYLCTNQQYLIVELFGSFEKTMERNPELFRKLFPSGHLAADYPSRTKEVLEIWKRVLQKQKSKLKPIVQKCVDEYYQDLEIECDTIKGNAIVQFVFYVDAFNAFLKCTKSSKANDFISIVGKTEEKLDCYITENGFSTDIPFDMNELEKAWNRTDERTVRLLAITHEFNNNNGKVAITSRLNNYCNPHSSVFDFIQTRSPKDSFYTEEHQQHLALTETIGTAMMLKILITRKVYVDYSDLVLEAVTFIENHFEIEGEQLSFDVQILFRMLQKMLENIQEEKADAIGGLCYGPAMFSCALLEKLLRAFYRWLAKEDKYVPDTQTALGDLLNSNNPYLNNSFGEIHIKNLRFYLLQSIESRAGQNVRNELAHLTISPKSVTPLLVAKCLWLFTDVLYPIFLYCNDDLNQNVD